MSAAMHYFITGTDTEIGKTLTTSAMLHALVKAGVRATGMKPIAAGAVMRQGVWYNEDVDCLATESNAGVPTELTTPYLLRDATAPHIAAAREGVTMSIAHILHCYQRVARQAEAVLVEGVGGFRVPLSTEETTSDLAKKLNLPVILVVGIRLGCLNHAVLTDQAIAARGLTVAGWVANVVDPDMHDVADNIDMLSAYLGGPLLGVIPHLPSPSPSVVAQYLDFSKLSGWPIPVPVGAVDT